MTLGHIRTVEYNSPERRFYHIAHLMASSIMKRRMDMLDADLRELYVVQRLSTPQIAKLYRCSDQAIARRLKTMGVKLRSMSEAHLVLHGNFGQQRAFNGDPMEKAYLIGFRTGDLSAGRRPHSDVVWVYGGSTRREQLDLIRSLFEPYAPLHVHTNGYLFGSLHCSFSFLIDKSDQVPAEVLKDDKLFLAFFAGLVDAEGCFCVSLRRGTPWASFVLGSTDRLILDQCREKLVALGVHCSKLSLARRAGQPSSNDVLARKDQWQVSVVAKESVLRLIEYLKPHLKHAKRCADMQRVEENVRWRQSEAYWHEVRGRIRRKPKSGEFH